jgi:nitrogen-specific signal transduction histidine kinase
MSPFLWKEVRMSSANCLAGSVAIAFSPEGRITSVSANTEQLAGCPAGELIGRPIVRLMTDDMAFAIPSMMDAAVRQGYWKGSIAFRMRGEEAVKAEGILYPLVSAPDSASGFLLISRECTSKQTLPLHEIEAALRELTHELNNPLAILVGFTQLLMCNSDCSEKIRADMEKLYLETARIIAVSDKLRALAVSLHERGDSLRDQQPAETADRQGVVKTSCIETPNPPIPG